MLEFHSASMRMANPHRAIDQLLDVCGCKDPDSCDLVLLNASIGHSLESLVQRIRRVCPRAIVVGGSCAGVVGREGVNESLKDIALMVVRGGEFAADCVDGVSGSNAKEKAEELARALYARDPGINMVYLLASGIDIAGDEFIAGFETVFGPEVTIFGAATSDNMRGIKSFQAFNDRVMEHGAVAVGFSDDSLEVDTRATHGFVAAGEPMVVTQVQGNRIIALDDEPAWPRYLERMGLPADAALGDTIPIGALAEALAEPAQQAYGNSHILRVITHVLDGVMLYPTTLPLGTKLWVTERDEERIFSDIERMTVEMQEFAAGRKPVAVFHADCLARGRRLFNRIVKEELVERMQHPFRDSEGSPPWLGMYGFGEYAQLQGRNAYHNYTTALAALYRKNT